MSFFEAAQLEEASRKAEGVMLPNGVRVIDVKAGSGPEPAEGQRVYIHYKFWTNRFEDDFPVESTYIDDRPAEFLLGSPTGKIFAGLDVGIRGMREGGWRRLVVPAGVGYGEKGLPMNKISRKAVAPGATLFVDVHLVDGGSGRCDKIFRELKYKTSMNCERFYR